MTELVDTHDSRLRVVLGELKLDQAKAVNVVLVRNIVIMSGIIVEADGGPEEELQVIAVADPEGAVVFANLVNLVFCVGGPLGRIVAPVALPLSFAMRVANLDKPLFLTVCEIDHRRINKAVGVSINQICTFNRIVGEDIVDLIIGLRRTSANHRVFALIGLKNLLPVFFGLPQGIVNSHAGGHARQGVKSFSGITCLDTLVIAKDLCPHFLYNE